MSAIDRGLDLVGRWLARRINTPAAAVPSHVHNDLAALRAVLRPGDVLLVDGSAKISTAIKYLRQSTWSHAAMYVGSDLACSVDGAPCDLVEANVGEGVVAAPLSKYAPNTIRVCRPVGLSEEDGKAVCDFMISRIGWRYDLRNVVDLARYLLPVPPVPVRFRRRMIALGSGDPTRAICSTLIAEAFQSVRYPILPELETVTRKECDDCEATTIEILHIRHHKLFAPRDFDLSPYFAVIKPKITDGFDYKRLQWAEAISRNLAMPPTRGHRADPAIDRITGRDQ